MEYRLVLISFTASEADFFFIDSLLPLRLFSH